MKIRDWIGRHPAQLATVEPDCDFGAMMESLLAVPGRRDLYVADREGRLLGHVSYRRLAELALAAHRPMHSRRQLMERVAGGTARELMDVHFVTAHPAEELDRVLHRQLEHGVEELPVVDERGIAIGGVRLSEVLREMYRASRGAWPP